VAEDDLERMRAERDLALEALLALLKAWHGIDELPAEFARCFTPPLPAGRATPRDLSDLNT